MSQNSSNSADCEIFRNQIIPKLYGYDLTQPAPCCDNSTVICQDSRITKILYTNFKLSGFIPQDLSSLSRLDTLYLDKNSLKGPIPTDLGSLKLLKYLHLEFNTLDGEIPSEMDGMSSLVDLFLNDNTLEGLVPAGLGNLKNLTQLRLENNFLIGTLPFQSQTPNSTFKFAPQKTKPPSPSPSSFNPIILPAILSSVGFILVLILIIWTVSRRKRLVDDQFARRVSGSTLASNHSIRTSKSSMDEELEALDPPAIVHSTTGGQIDNTPVKVDENV